MTRKMTLTLGAAAIVIAAAAIAASAHDMGRDGGGAQRMMRGEHAEGMQDHRGPGMMRRGDDGQMGRMGQMGMGRMADSPLFSAFGTDTDGTVSAAEAEAGLAALLAAHDADGDGTLSRAEFDALFADATRHRADRPFAMLDADGNARIDATEIQFPAQMMARKERMQDAVPGAERAPQ